jgi:hypothetical protein
VKKARAKKPAAASNHSDDHVPEATVPARRRVGSKKPSLNAIVAQHLSDDE